MGHFLKTDGKCHFCEKRLIEEAHGINNSGKMHVPIIDDTTSRKQIPCAACDCSLKTSPQ
ncbi:MAG: hypothetical protein JXR76_07665 [Deltaproteobacteria bacterium]|nr:hypothetical protein [Deltaproteobacteria bacterium]